MFGSRNSRSTTERHPVDQVPPPWQLVASGVQHVAAMYAGVVAPPLVIGAAVGLSRTELALLISASLFTAGLATLLQSIGVWRIGSRLPLVNGVSFATVAPILAIVKQHGQHDALPVVYGATLVGGAFVVLAAPYFGKLTRLFPPVVNGTVVMLIGLSMLPVGIDWIRGDDPHSPDYGAPRSVLLAAFTLLVVLLCNRFLRGFAQRVSLLIGLAAGTLLAWPLGAVDASSLRSAPTFSFVTPLHFGVPQFSVAAVVSMLIVMLTVMTESTADMVALGEVVHRPINEHTIANGLRADGVATAVSAMFGGMACSAFAQNIGLIALTRVYSRFVVSMAGLVLVLLGLFPVAGGVVALVPQPVLGGAGIVLFGSVAASGIKTLAGVDMSAPSNVLIVATALGVGVIPIVAPDFYQRFPEAVQTILGSGISAGCVAAILLNLLLRRRDRNTSGAATEQQAIAAPRTSTEERVDA